GPVVVVAGGGVDGAEPVGPAGFHRLEDLVDRHLGPLGDLGDGGGAAQLLRQVVDHRPHPQVQLLHPAGNPHGPALVAEVALQLTDDRRGGERRELQPPARIEPLDGLQQPEEGDLDEVLDRLAPVLESAGEVLGQADLRGDDLVAQRLVAALAVLLELAPQLAAIGRFKGHRLRLALLLQPERDLAVVPRDLVLVDEGVEDLLREVGRLRDGPGQAGAAGDRDEVVAGRVGEVHRAGLGRRVVVDVAEEVEAQLVDGDAQVLHFVEGEPQPAGEARGGEPDEPEVFRGRRHDQAHVASPAQCFPARFPLLAFAHHLPAPRGPVQDHGAGLLPNPWQSQHPDSGKTSLAGQTTPASRQAARSAAEWPSRPAKTASLSAPGARPRWRTAPGVATNRDTSPGTRTGPSGSCSTVGIVSRAAYCGSAKMSAIVYIGAMAAPTA